MKFRTEKGKWIIEDNGGNVIFDNSYDAWQYIFLMMMVRPKVPQVARSLYPVRSLNPMPSMVKKKVIFTYSKEI